MAHLILASSIHSLLPTPVLVLVLYLATVLALLVTVFITLMFNSSFFVNSGEEARSSSAGAPPRCGPRRT